jgi:two-component sensor histidine kinase
LILNELLTNCLKHAFPPGRGGTIMVSFHPTEESTYCLVVRDDGAGLPPHLDVDTSTSLGLRLIRILTTQLCGSLQYENHDGTAITVRFPLQHSVVPHQEEV